MKFSITEKIIEFTYTGTIAGFGGLANYIYYLSRGNRFSINMFIFNIILGFFIGNVVGEFIPETFEYRDGILLISGFGLWHLLAFLQEKAPELLIKKLSGYNIDDEKDSKTKGSKTDKRNN